MAIEVKRLGRTFFAEVRGIDLRKTPGAEEIAVLRRAIIDHGVLVFPGQDIDDAEQAAFSACFGALEPTHHDPNDFVADLSNIDEDGNFRDPDSRMAKFLRSNELWHSDSSYYAVPARLSFLSARALPPADTPGGETQWADTKAAWEALPPERRKELDGLIVEHSLQTSRRAMGLELSEEERRRWPPVHHPLVRIHEWTGQKALYPSSQATRILGLPEGEGRRLLEEMMEWATQDRFVYTHKWTLHDLVVWDNRRVLHRRRPFDETRYRRIVHRTTALCAGPTVDGGKRVDEHARLEAAPA